MTVLEVADRTSYDLPSYMVSSSYLLILNRYLDLLRLNDENPITSKMRSPSSLTLNYTIDIHQIKPILNQLENALGRSNFGLDIGRKMHPSDYGIFGYAMMNCENLLTALRTAAEHKTILNQKLFADFIESDELIVYQLNTDLRSKEAQILIELDFSTAVEFGQRLAGPEESQTIEISSVHFSHKPLGPLKDYEDCFQCPVYFEQAHNQIRIERKALEVPIYGANPKVLSALEEKMLKVATHAASNKNLGQRVALYVSKNLYREIPSAHQAASDFFMSLSSFKKRLSDEQTCYQNICNEVRYKKCIELLVKDKKTLKEIAFELGFSNASGFNRAFKRWTGKSPSEYKKESSHATIC